MRGRWDGERTEEMGESEEGWDSGRLPNVTVTLAP